MGNLQAWVISEFQKEELCFFSPILDQCHFSNMKQSIAMGKEKHDDKEVKLKQKNIIAVMFLC